MTEIAVTGRRPKTLRRRFDNEMLRWQARLDGEWADRVLPWCAAVVLFAVYAFLALARAHSLGNGRDLAAALQGAWFLRHGNAPDLTITGHNLFADQAPFAFYPLSLLTGILPARSTLLLVQSFALASAVVPIWRIARRRADLRVGASVAVLLAYGLSPAVNDLNLADFHQEALALPALIGAAYNGLSGRWRRFAVLAVFAVACRADLAIAVAGLGAVFWVEGKRRAGQWTVVLSLTYLAIVLLVLEPWLGESSLVAPGAFRGYGEGPAGVIGHIVAHPITTLGDLASQPHLDVAVVLFAPLLFLPLLAPRYLLPALPLEALYLLANVPATGLAGARYTVPITAFSFVATPFALSRMGHRNISRVNVDRRALAAMVIASLAFFARDAASSPYERPWSWARESADNAARRAAATLVDRGERVRASAHLLPLVAERAEVWNLPVGDRPSPRAATAGTDAVVIDAHSYRSWSAGQQADFTDQLRIDGFDLVYDRAGVLVYVRDTTRATTAPPAPS